MSSNALSRHCSTCSSDKELFKAMKECGEYKLKDEKGYEIIQGEELLN